MKFKVGYIGLLGLPNAGKSTLANTLVGEKVSIVTAKPQTTRQRILGIRTHGQTQAIFIDAPGWIQATSGLNAFLQSELQDILNNSDLLLAVLNLDEQSPEGLQKIVELARASKKPTLAVLTKTDLGFDHRIVILKDQLQGLPVVSGSALKEPKQFTEAILPWIEEHLPPAENFLYEPDDFTPHTVRQMAGEVVREKCFELLHQEIPYGLAVRIENFREDDGPVVKIQAEILVAKENHKAMVIGKGGENIKKIGILSRKDIEAMIGRQVHLELHVRAQKDWMKNERLMKELGYVLPQ